MIEPVVVGVLIPVVLACVGWLGGGRKWAFRSVLAALVLVVIGVATTSIYIFWTDKAAEHRAKCERKSWLGQPAAWRLRAPLLAKNAGNGAPADVRAAARYIPGAG